LLILSYFYPPSSFTGGQRVFAWAKYLHQFGYYPVIITRNWDTPIAEYRDMSRTTGTTIRHEKHANFEVYYLPYKGNARDRIYAAYGEKRLRFVRRFLSFFELFLQNYFFAVLPWYNIYRFADAFLKKNPDVTMMIASARPFALFGFCHSLSKKHKIPWIADYRDDWNTSQWHIPSGLTGKMLSGAEARSEKRWLSNAACIISVSEYYAERIASWVGKQGYVVMNGFDRWDFSDIIPHEKEQFTIAFSGTLYDTQPVEIFTEAYKRFVASEAGAADIRLVFLGLGMETKQVIRIKMLLAGFEKNFEITARVEKKEALQSLAGCDVFLMFSHENIKGVTSSKIFDYLALSKPVILCPGDDDVLDDLIRSTGAGFIVQTADEIYPLLKHLYGEYKQHGRVSCTTDWSKIAAYSRENQTKRLARVLDDVLRKQAGA
jgi:glycosyltransferase involved in cell wall biosynthesis